MANFPPSSLHPSLSPSLLPFIPLSLPLSFPLPLSPPSLLPSLLPSLPLSSLPASLTPVPPFRPNRLIRKHLLVWVDGRPSTDQVVKHSSLCPSIHGSTIFPPTGSYIHPAVYPPTRISHSSTHPNHLSNHPSSTHPSIHASPPPTHPSICSVTCCMDSRVAPLADLACMLASNAGKSFVHTIVPVKSILKLCITQELGVGEFDDSMPVQSIFSLPGSGSVPYHKRRKGGNPTSTGPPPSPPPFPLLLPRGWLLLLVTLAYGGLEHLVVLTLGNTQRHKRSLQVLPKDIIFDLAFPAFAVGRDTNTQSNLRSHYQIRY